MTGLTVVGAVAATLAVARQPTWSRLGLVVAVTLVIALAAASLGRSGRHARLGPVAGRRVAVLDAVCGLALIAVLVRLGWWIPLIAVPGVAIGEAVRRGRNRGSRARVPLRPRLRWLVAAVVLLIAAPWIWSIETTLAAPNTDQLSVRAVEWIRDHGGVSIVDDIEHWWYTRHPPPVGGKPKELVGQHPRSGATTTTIADPPALARVPTPAATPLGNEGLWTVTSGTPARPIVATTLVRPDAIHTSLVVGIMSIDPRYARLRLLSGTEQPGGPSANGATIPPADRAGVLAAFNAGFRITESRGGWYSEGHTVVPLQNGAASLVFRDDGRADVGVWGRDDVMGPHVTAVRQNLALIVDNSRPVAGIDDSANVLWGKTVGHKVLVPRSGVGITQAGRLVYVGGPGMSVQTLANTLIAAGAVRAMELDINRDWVAAYTFQQSALGPVGTKLVDAMHDPPSHYLTIGTRDFIAVLAK